MIDDEYVRGYKCSLLYHRDYIAPRRGRDNPANTSA